MKRLILVAVLCSVMNAGLAQAQVEELHGVVD